MLYFEVSGVVHTAPFMVTLRQVLTSAFLNVSNIMRRTLSEADNGLINDSKINANDIALSTPTVLLTERASLWQ